MSRKRQAFSGLFRSQAVRPVCKREASGMALVQFGRKFGVRTNVLRKRARTVAVPRGGLIAGTTAKLEAEVQRLQRENEVLRQEDDFASDASAQVSNEIQ